MISLLYHKPLYHITSASPTACAITQGLQVSFTTPPGNTHTHKQKQEEKEEEEEEKTRGSGLVGAIYLT